MSVGIISNAALSNWENVSTEHEIEAVQKLLDLGAEYNEKDMVHLNNMFLTGIVEGVNSLRGSDSVETHIQVANRIVGYVNTLYMLNKDGMRLLGSSKVPVIKKDGLPKISPVVRSSLHHLGQLVSKNLDEKERIKELVVTTNRLVQGLQGYIKV